MSDNNINKKEKSKSLMSDLSFDDKQKWVGTFAWLIQEDKKQNPELYQIKNNEQND